MEKEKNKDRLDGISYLISGSLAIIGGTMGTSIASDPAEKVAYSLFQTIGIASVGYGAYVWQLGSKDLEIYEILNRSELTFAQRSQFLEIRKKIQGQREKKEKWIKAITHGLIAATNLYSASQQKDSKLQNALVFVGSVNTLASVTYIFDF